MSTKNHSGDKRGGFVSISDVAGTLPGVVSRGRAMSAQTRHHFTTLRQVNQLIEASEADADMGFMPRLLALCSLPRTNPKTRLQYVRRNGPYTLYVTVNAGAKLPFGNLPRLLLAWVYSEAVRTQSRELVLGRSLYEFMRKLGMEDRSGGENAERTRLKNQMRRLFGCTVTLVYEDEERESRVSSLVADRADYWWNAKRPAAPVLWDSTIELGEKFFQEIIAHPVPLDLNILRSLKRSPLGLDLYFWLTYRTFALKSPLQLSWRQLYRQFGAEPDRASKVAQQAFRRDCLRELKKIKRAWPDLHYETVTGGLLLSPSPPRIPPAQLQLIGPIGRRAARLPVRGVGSWGGPFFWSSDVRSRLLGPLSAAGGFPQSPVILEVSHRLNTSPTYI